MKNIEGSIIRREYSNLRGVDFSNDETKVSLNRSPKSVNCWKDYKSQLGQAVETRAGFRVLKRYNGVFHQVGENIHEYKTEIIRFHTFKIEDKGYFLIHYKVFDTSLNKYVGKVDWWVNYPNENMEVVTIQNDVGVSFGGGFIFEKGYYFLDGLNIYRYTVNNSQLVVNNISEIAFVPTTAIVTKDGVMEKYQDYNGISGRQKNQLYGNGSRTEFSLYPAFVDREIVLERVTVNGEIREDCTLSQSDFTYKLTFTVAPIEDGEIVVEFSQNIIDEITSCDKAVVYENRVILANCQKKKNKFFFSALNDPTYFPATNFEYAGVEEQNVVGLIVMSSSVALIKEGSGSNGYIYNISSVTTEAELMPVVYRVTEISSSIGGIGGAINFKNDIVFLSKQGLQAITRLDLHNERNIEHRSSLVDGKLVNEKGLDRAKLGVFGEYLIILINGKMYLANSREKSQLKDVEYEWYYFEDVGVLEEKESGSKFYNGTSIEVFEDRLFVGTSNGCICCYNDDMKKMSGLNTPLSTGELRSEAYQDDYFRLVDGELVKDVRAIYSCWCTPIDDFNARNRFKRCNKRGSVADLKSFSHSRCKLAIKTDGGFYKDNSQHNSGYFDFSDIDFTDFTFNTSERNEYYFKAKNKKWARLSLEFYSDEIRKPFGIFGVTIEAIIQGYAKEKNNG